MLPNLLRAAYLVQEYTLETHGPLRSQQGPINHLCLRPPLLPHQDPPPFCPVTNQLLDNQVKSVGVTTMLLGSSLGGGLAWVAM